MTRFGFHMMMVLTQFASSVSAENVVRRVVPRLLADPTVIPDPSAPVRSVKNAEKKKKGDVLKFIHPVRRSVNTQDVANKDAQSNTRGSSPICEAKQVAEANAQTKMAERNALISELPVLEERNRVASMNATTYYSGLMMDPYYPCLWTLARTKLVKVNQEGGKWICGLPQLGSNRRHQIVYAIGSSGERSFEDKMLQEIGDNVEIHIYDPTMADDKANLQAWINNLPKQMHFHDMGIKGEGVTTEFQALTLQEAMQQNNHEHGADILKFDIEGYEYELLDTTNWSGLKFGIISFEFHANHARMRGLTLEKLFLQLFKKLEDAGYRLYSAEPVCALCTGQVELAWIHRDWDPNCGFSCSCLA